MFDGAVAVLAATGADQGPGRLDPALIRAVVPYGRTAAVPPAAPTVAVSASSGDSFGAMLISRPGSALALAETLVHEFQHSKLAALLHLFPLLDDDREERYYAPWRADPRHLTGLLHGAYAFTGVAGFWRDRLAEPEHAEVAAYHFALRLAPEPAGRAHPADQRPAHRAGAPPRRRPRPDAGRLAARARRAGRAQTGPYRRRAAPHPVAAAQPGRTRRPGRHPPLPSGPRLLAGHPHPRLRRPPRRPPDRRRAPGRSATRPPPWTATPRTWPRTRPTRTRSPAGSSPARPWTRAAPPGAP
ncbi:HEXXH motif-containing putative peptide modification protein [Streptomyces sp. UP1A-1]|nr:HEXXH motif-containing putative peptide modification protein [Streptomyces sp. UP1A-1]